MCIRDSAHVVCGNRILQFTCIGNNFKSELETILIFATLCIEQSLVYYFKHSTYFTLHYMNVVVRNKKYKVKFVYWIVLSNVF